MTDIVCTHCHESKPPDEYNDEPRKRNGKKSWCRACVRERNRGFGLRNPTSGHRAHIKMRYGVTGDQFDKMLADQCGVCAICHKPETGTRLGTVRQLSVDHDHTTGQTRQLLCGHCNRGLGQFRDDPAALTAAAAYLVRHAPG